MDISAIEGEELKAVEFVEDFLQLRFGEPLLKLYHWPYVMLTDFSVAFGEPEYRNALCAQIGEQVATATLEEDDALTIELANGVVLGLRCGKKMWMDRSRGVIPIRAMRRMRGSFRGERVPCP